MIKKTKIQPTVVYVSWFLLCVVLVAAFSGCSSRSKLPEKGTKEYAEVVSTFYVGLAALQVGHDIYAEIGRAHV